MKRTYLSVIATMFMLSIACTAYSQDKKDESVKTLDMSRSETFLFRSVDKTYNAYMADGILTQKEELDLIEKKLAIVKKEMKNDAKYVKNGDVPYDKTFLSDLHKKYSSRKEELNKTAQN